MQRNIWLVLCAIAAVVLAWFVVDIALRMLWLAARLGIVAVVAIGIFLLLRGLFAKRE